MAASDATLVLKALNGDQAAFGELYDRYAGLVRAIGYDSISDRDAVQDLTQEVFIRAYTKLSGLKEPDRFGPWLVGMAKNVGREFRRGKARDRHVLVGLEPEAPAVEATDEQQERLKLVSEAMKTLDEQEQLALHVHYLRNENADEGKKLLGMSRSSYYRLLDRAKKKIGKILESDD